MESWRLAREGAVRVLRAMFRLIRQEESLAVWASVLVLLRRELILSSCLANINLFRAGQNNLMSLRLYYKKFQGQDLIILGYKEMGNACCCEDEPNRPRAATRPPVRSRGSSVHFKVKMEDPLLKGQKTLLHDFGPAVRYLKQHGQEQSGSHYTGFYSHARIGSDEVSDYWTGTVIDENGIEFECIVKQINKAKVSSYLQKKSLAVEYLVTRYLSYHFVINCLHFHEDDHSLFLLFDLRSYEHLSAYDKNSPKAAFSELFYRNLEANLQFVVAGIVLGLEKLHAMGVVYRGVNTENIVIMDNGYPLLTNLSKLHPEGTGDAAPAANHFTSPEEFRGQAVTRATDCWALGVLIYYFCKGTFINYSIFQEREFTAEGISPELIGLVNQLLLFKPEQRLGSRGVGSIKSHKFFKSFKWQEYGEMELDSPLSIDQTHLPKDIKSKEQNQESNYCGMTETNYSMMGLMLCMDFMALQMISNIFETERPAAAEDGELKGEEHFNNEDEFQLATEIDIGADYD